jgi:cytochrome c
MKLVLTAAALVLAFSGATHAASGPDLIGELKCTKCHKAKTGKTGPSYADVAAKNAGKADAADRLFTYLKTGGKMSDGDEHKKVEKSDEEIKAIVATILASK